MLLDFDAGWGRHWIGPVIDRVVATIGTFLVCFIAACDATGFITNMSDLV